MSVLHRIAFARQRLYALLEQSSGDDRLSSVVDWSLIALVVATLAATVMESVPKWATAYHASFETIEYTALVVFSAEYAARLWTAREYPPWRRLGAVRSAFRFAVSPAGLIDLAAVAPFWLMFLVAADFRTLLALRLIRFFKLAPLFLRHAFTA